MKISLRGELIGQTGGQKVFRKVAGRVETFCTYKKFGIVPQKKVQIEHLSPLDTNPGWLSVHGYKASEGKIITSQVRNGKNSYIERYRYLTGDRGSFIPDTTGKVPYYKALPNTQIDEVFVNGHQPHIIKFKSPDGDVFQITRYNPKTNTSHITTKINNIVVSERIG